MFKKMIPMFLAVMLIFSLAACATETPAPAAETSEEEVAEEAVVEEVEEEAVAEEPAEEVAEETAAEDITIRALIRPDEGANIATFSEKFTEETGIKVEVDFVGWAEIHDKTITTLAGGGGGYDIIFMPSANVAEFTAGGWFEPLNDMITAENSSEWLQSVVDMYTIDGDLLAMPWYAGGAHMVYNGAVLEAAGVDPMEVKTWDDFMAACEAISAAGAADFCFSPSAKYAGNYYYNIGSILASGGEEFFDAEGNPVFQDSELALKSFDLIAEGIEKGYFDPAGIALDDYETLIEFGAGTTAFMINSTWSATQATQNPELSAVTDSAGIMLIPGWSEDPRSGGVLYAGGLGLLSTSENKDAAKQFLAYITSEEAQKHHAIEGGNLPTRMALYSDADIAASWPGFDVLAEQLPYGVFAPQFTWFEEWRQSAATAVQDVISGAKTSAEAIEWLAEESARIKAD